MEKVVAEVEHPQVLVTTWRRRMTKKTWRRRMTKKTKTKKPKALEEDVFLRV